MPRKKSGVEEEIDRLFSLPPEEFIAARDDLAKRLKAEGRTEEAAEVKALHRPTVAAWAANQVARRNPSDVDELLKAGAELRAAQRKLASGVKGEGFREAVDRRRRAVAALVKVAEEVLSEAGKGSAGTLEAVQASFETAAVSEEGGEQLRAGRMTKELPAASGFGEVTGLEVVAAPAEKPERRRAKRGEDDESARAEIDAAPREAKELQKEAAEARRRAIKARAHADRLAEKAKRLERQTEEARAAAKDAAEKAREEEAEAQRAETAAARAQRDQA